MWFFGRTKKLKQELDEKNKELESLRAKLSEKEGQLGKKIDELAKANNSLESVNKELSGSKKRIADFESKQKTISSAMTQKERILREAREQAAKIEADGKKRRDEFITAGKSIEEKAKANAEKTLEDARTKAKKDAERTLRDAEKAASDAEKRSREMLEQAEQSVNSMMDKAHEHVKESEGRLDELNKQIKERERFALEDSDFYSDSDEMQAETISVHWKGQLRSDEKAVAAGAAKVAHDMKSAMQRTGKAAVEETDVSDEEETYNAAALMRSIYAIQQRELPGYAQDAANDDGFSMPVDEGFAELVGEVMND